MIRLVTDDLHPPGPPPKRHFISVADLTRDDVERLLGTARTFATSLERHVKKLPTLKGHLVVNLFYESSTRKRWAGPFRESPTRSSRATRRLGMSRSSGSRRAASRSRSGSPG